MKPRRGRPTLPAEPCMTPGCGTIRAGRNRGGRGVCKRCQNAYAYLVRTKQATWDGLERAGLVLAKALPFKMTFLKEVPWSYKGKR